MSSSAPPKTVVAERDVPAYRKQEFHEPRRRYCVCVFVIDEGLRFERQLSRMQSLQATVDIIVADGGSTDGSTNSDKLARSGVRTLLVKTGPGRLSAQMRMAFDYALAQGYEGIVTVDGNDKDDTSAVHRFIEALDKGYDHVQGSRYIAGGKAVNTPLLRHYAVTLVHAPLISWAAGLRYTDTTNGFRAYSRRLLLDPRVAPFRDVFSDYELHYYLAIRAARLGFRCCEVPVTRTYPRETQTPTKIRGLGGNLRVMKTLLAATTGKWNPTL
ncbi:MAG TPA: glycosyltransferase family 2 protein [Gemmatimonadaceae bacterium]|nr:glycosyltransferase family 2 protein [Gemmatimonadaceae bacterium]